MNSQNILNYRTASLAALYALADALDAEYSVATFPDSAPEIVRERYNAVITELDKRP